MGGSSVTLTQADQRLSNIRIQTSSQGLVIPKGWGRYRVGCNLIWYGDFRAIEHRSVQEQGGKGGGGEVRSETITYTYEAAVMVGLGHGQVLGVPSAWKGKQRLQGEAVPESHVVRHIDVEVPNLGGDFRFFFNPRGGSSTFVVNLPTDMPFVSLVSVRKKSQRIGINQWTYLKEGVQFTRSGSTITFNSKAEAGDYRISWKAVAVAAYWRSALGQLNLSLHTGTIDQPVWSHLASNHADQALAYPNLAVAFSPAYALTSAAEMHNHNFECQTDSELGVLPGRTEPVVDADPAVVCEQVITDEAWGVGWESARIGGLDRYSDYCVANGFWLSPVLTEQVAAAEALQGILQLTNTDVVYDGSELTFVPLGDEDATGNGRTWVADVTPVVDLTLDHLMSSPGEPPLLVRRHFGEDGDSETASGDDVGFNIWTLEIENRDNGYATEPVSYEDTAHIAVHGRRQKPTIKAPAIKSVELGSRIATLLCIRELSQRNTYECEVPWTLGFLRPLQLVTLTDPGLGLDRRVARVRTVEELDDGDRFRLVLRSCDLGTASAPLYGAEAGAGYAADHNVSPGNVYPPVLFEPPVELATATGLEVWIAVTGETPMWGGAEVWASMDGGVTYRRITTVRGGARYGVLASDLAAGAGASMDLQLGGRGGQMLDASAADAAALNSLLMVRSPGGQPEYLAHQSALLAGSNRYTLGGLVRGAYDSISGAHSAGSVVVRVDDAVARSEPLQLSMIGQTIRFKFLSFNVFGGGMQGLEDVPEYAYTVTGDMARLPPRNVVSFSTSTQGDGTRVFSWSWGATAKPADLRGYVVRYRQGSGWTWDEMLPFVTDDGFFTSSPIETNQLLAGAYTFAIKTVDQMGVLADQEVTIEATLPDPRLGNALVFRQLQAEGWPGTLTNGVIDTSGGAAIIRAADQATWDDVPTPWTAWTRWIWDPFSTVIYQPPAEDFGAIVSVLPVFNSTGFGDVLFEESHGNDGVTWSPWAAVAGVVLARHVRVRITLTLPAGSPTGPGLTPVLTRETGSLSFIGRVDSEFGNDISPAALTAPHRIGVGHFRLPTSKVWAYYSRIGLTLQSVGPGWTWELVDKDLVNGPAIKTYNASLALADPPLIDFDIEGILAS